MSSGLSENYFIVSMFLYFGFVDSPGGGVLRSFSTACFTGGFVVMIMSLPEEWRFYPRKGKFSGGKPKGFIGWN